MEPILENFDSMPRSDRYPLLVKQARALIEAESDEVANLANLSALLKEGLGVLWVGFYRRVGEELILGPFQGPLACTRIPISRGVCGACVREKKTIVVPDVNLFLGHIACSSKSRSEIVVPLIRNGEVALVLDLDSEIPEDFDEKDVQGLEAIIQLLA